MKLLLTEVDNGIFNVLRKYIVSQGYCPDLTEFMDGDYNIDSVAYQAAKQGIIDEGREIIEVHNSSGNSSRGEMKTHMMYITRIGADPATTGTGIHYDYKFNEEKEKYEKTRPAHRFDVTYQISYVTDSEDYAAIIEAFMAKAFGVRKLITPYRSDYTELTEGNFWLMRSTPFDTSNSDFLERGCRYTAKFIDIQGPEELGDIAPFDITKFVLELQYCDRETILKKLEVTLDPLTGAVTGYVDVFKTGIKVINEPFTNNLIVVGPYAEYFRINQDTGEVIYLDPKL